ncbi:uncharacterized protein LOC112559135 isoform X1 [Pomacea canaliculata]|uniref:uncharacterized protein LOC112559135 isoform X1 n=1 Tax=Pomacea canaliculata TaxID=400727 RepID=UPI000D73E333|nr:uncharacterized protein LOC112559135 isoform X1 [Pomacea canaliculata]XP_025085905.1 uncharacterized protein LOC112559135 isoform X1 [Pomacea canaliculata]
MHFDKFKNVCGRHFLLCTDWSRLLNGDEHFQEVSMDLHCVHDNSWTSVCRLFLFTLPQPDGLFYFGKKQCGHMLCMENDWSRERYQCQDKRQMGNWPVCFDKNLIPQSNCLVYSFGIDYDFRFDDAMANIGCTVYSFDPSMLDTPDHKRGDRVFFKRMGISDKDDDHFVPRVDEYVEKRRAVNGWPMRRLQTILDQLGHKKEQLTVLKLDIEGYEWDVTRDLLDSGILSSVPQFLVEWHLFTDFPPRERVPDAVDTYFRVSDMGFQLFSTGVVYSGFNSANSLRILAEVAYLNTKII